MVNFRLGSAQFGLDYRQEQANKERHNEQFGLPISNDRPDLPPVPGGDDGRQKPPEDDGIPPDNKGDT